MRFCSRIPRNPLRLRAFGGFGGKGDPMPRRKKTGREFRGGRSDTPTATAATDQRLKE